MTENYTDLIGWKPFLEYEGASPGSWTPSTLPVSIGGHQYNVDLEQLRLTTMQVRRVALDDSVEPAEQSLNAAGVWPRAQDNWFLGAGQLFLDNRFAFETIYTHSGESPSVRTRFWRSKRLVINTEGQLTLQRAQTQVYPVAAINDGALWAPNVPQQVIEANNYLYISDGPYLYFTSQPGIGGTPVWTKAFEASNNILSLTTDGYRVWAACGEGGVYVTNAGTPGYKQAARPAALIPVSGLIATVDVSGPVGSELAPRRKYTYAVTAVDAFDNETNAPVGSTVLVKEGAVVAAPVTLSWDAVPGAVSYNIYRLNEGGAWRLQGNQDSSLETWIDNGSYVGLRRPGLPSSSSNTTGTGVYGATFVSYCSGYLIASTGRDLVNLLASGVAQEIYTHPAPGFVWAFAFSTPTAIHVGGSNGNLSFIGAIQPDPATQGANLAPPYTATTLSPGEVPYDISYNAGSIILATSVGVRTGTTPDSTGVFDINAAITDPGAVYCLASQSNFCYFGWTLETGAIQPGSPYPVALAQRPGVVCTGLGRLDLSQYTSIGVPAYATDVMCPDLYPDGSADGKGETPGGPSGAVNSIALINQVPFYAVAGSGIWGPSAKYEEEGWLEAGWTRYSSTEQKILARGQVMHMPLAGGCNVELDAYTENGDPVVLGISSAPGTAGPLRPWLCDNQAGSRFMPVIRLRGDGWDTPVLHQWQQWAMVVPVRQDEIMLPLIWAEVFEDVTLGGAPHSMNTYTEFVWLKSLETSGRPVAVSIGKLSFQAYIDQVQVNPGKAGKWNSDRSFVQGIVTVKLISLQPLAGWGATGNVLGGED